MAEHTSFAKMYKPDGTPSKWMVWHNEEEILSWFLVSWESFVPYCSQCGAPLHEFFDNLLNKSR